MQHSKFIRQLFATAVVTVQLAMPIAPVIAQADFTPPPADETPVVEQVVSEEPAVEVVMPTEPVAEEAVVEESVPAEDTTVEVVNEEPVADEAVVEPVVLKESAVGGEESVVEEISTLNATPSLTTDKADYAPTDVVTILGKFFKSLYTLVLNIFGGFPDGSNQVTHEDTVTTDEQGEFIYEYQLDGVYRPDYTVTAIDADSGEELARTTFTDAPPQVSLEQCRNGAASSPVNCTGSAWTNGNAGASNAHYVEGQSIPYRAIMTNLPIGVSITITLGYDIKHSGRHAIDYLTHYHRILESVDPINGTGAPATFTTFPIPAPSSTGSPVPGQPTASFNALPAGERLMTLFGGTITAISYPTQGSLTAAQSETQISITFTAFSPTAVLSWGGHIGAAADWGAGNSAGGISGSPYHMRTISWTQGNIGNQDRSLSAGAVITPSTITIRKQTNPDQSAGSFDFTTTGGLTPSSFSLSDDGIQTFSVAPGSYSVTENNPGPAFALTNLNCSSSGTGTSATPNLASRTVAITIGSAGGGNVDCTFTNTLQQGTLVINKVAIGGDGTFNYTVTGPTPLSSSITTSGGTGSSDPMPANAGTNYAITETVPSGWDFTSATCDKPFTIGTNGVTAVTVVAGQTTTCTFTNTKLPKLTVIKVLSPSNDSGKFDLIINNVTYATNVGNGGTTGAQLANVGSNSFGETGNNTNLSNYFSVISGPGCVDNGNGTGSINLAAGEEKTCTITNTLKQCKLVLTKSVDKAVANVGDIVNYTITFENQGNIYCTGGGVRIEDVVDSRLQFISETHSPAYNTIPWGISAGYGCPAFPGGSDPCVGGEPLFDGTKLVWSGHEMPPGAIGTITWSAMVKPTQCGPFDIPNQASATAAELSGPVYSNIVHTTGSAACLKVDKVLVPSQDSGLFNLQIDGVTKATDVGNGGTTGFVVVANGVHTVGETAGTGTSLGNYNSVIGGQCATNGTVTLAAGENKVCTITNTRILALQVSKTATTTFTRTFGWTIDKSVTPSTLNMFTGDTGTANYTVTVTKDAGTDSAWAVSGSITITNPNTTLSATITGVTDVISNQGAATVNCPVSFPHVLAPGANLVCTYSKALTDGDSETNTATVTTSGIVPGGSGQAAVTFGTPTTLVNDTVTVNDTNGSSWPFSASGQQQYSRNFTCNADEGQHNNTATIMETGQSDSVSVTVNCYGLTVTKTAVTSFDRTWDWTIDKTSPTTSLTMAPDQVLPVNYTVSVNATKTDDNYAVGGTITITNPAPIPATVTAVSDLVSGGFNAPVVCPGDPGPYVIAANGGTLVCNYVIGLPDADSRTNTATATLQNTPSGTTNFTGSMAVTFSATPTNEYDECINVVDDLYGALGSACANETLPKVFNYTKDVGPYSDAYCGQTPTVINTATFTTNDTQTTGSDGHTVNVSVVCTCTLTQGYWKTHNTSFKGGAPADPNWFNAVTTLGEATPFYSTGKTWFEIFWTAPKGNAYYQLAHQYMAAKLNMLSGASAPPSVIAAIAYAESFFQNNTPTNWPKSQKNTILNNAGILGSYNEGLIGPVHCSE